MSGLVVDSRAFEAAAHAALEDYRRDGKKAIKRDAQRVRDRAQQLVRVDTGKLRDNILVEEGTDYVDVGVDSNEVPYAQDQEFGTSTMAAQPYMRPAIAEVEANPSTGEEAL